MRIGARRRLTFPPTKGGERRGCARRICAARRADHREQQHPGGDGRSSRKAFEKRAITKNSPTRTRTLNLAVNSRSLYH
jgi:hypothetical protein